MIILMVHMVSRVITKIFKFVIGMLFWLTASFASAEPVWVPIMSGDITFFITAVPLRLE